MKTEESFFIDEIRWTKIFQMRICVRLKRSYPLCAKESSLPDRGKDSNKSWLQA